MSDFPRFILRSSSNLISIDSDTMNIISLMFDNLFENDRYNEAIQNSLNTYHEEIFSLKDEYKIDNVSFKLQIIDENQSKCFICLENFQINDDIYKLECNHIFHKECLDDSIKHQHYECCLCKHSIKVIEKKIDTYENENGHIIQFRQ